VCTWIDRNLSLDYNWPMIISPPQILLQGKNPGVSWEYTLPHPEKKHNYTWSVVRSDCSAPCAGGESVPNVICMFVSLTQVWESGEFLCLCVVEKGSVWVCLSRSIKCTFVSRTERQKSGPPSLQTPQSHWLISVVVAPPFTVSFLWVLVADRQHYDMPRAQISICALTQFHSCFSLEQISGQPLLASHTDRGPALFASTEATLQYCHSSWASVIPRKTIHGQCAQSLPFQKFALMMHSFIWEGSLRHIQRE